MSKIQKVRLKATLDTKNTISSSYADKAGEEIFIEDNPVIFRSEQVVPEYKANGEQTGQLIRIADIENYSVISQKTSKDFNPNKAFEQWKKHI